MAMVAIYHGTAYIDQACASTISTMRYALMDYCVQGPCFASVGASLSVSSLGPWKVQLAMILLHLAGLLQR